MCGDFHYGANGMVNKQEIIDALNKDANAYKGNIFRILTGDLVENQLKLSVGHNYDAGIADPAKQRADMIDVLKKTNACLYGTKAFKNLSEDELKTHSEFTGVLCAGVEGNHEYRTRKTSGQWLSQQIHEASKVLDLGMQAIIHLTICNKKLKMERTFRIFVAHRPSKTDAVSSEAILRAFRKKLSTLPGVDIIVFGHTHKKFLAADSYTDTASGELRKVLFVVNPSPMEAVEYAQEAGYPPMDHGYSTNVHLPLDCASPIWGIV